MSGNYLAQHNSAPAIRTGVATIESMLISGNWWGYGTELVSDPAGRIQNLTVLDTGAHRLPHRLPRVRAYRQGGRGE